MLNIFYVSGVNNITMSAVTCSPNSDKCNTIANCYLPTQIAPSNFTGLAAVNVNKAQDWRVYYHDEDGYISELQGDNSGFNLGKPIGGSGLNASSIAAVNVNSTTNNINIFYVDGLTQALFKMQFTADAWTKRKNFPPTASQINTLIFALSINRLCRSHCFLESQIWTWCCLHGNSRSASCLLHRTRCRYL